MSKEIEVKFKVSSFSLIVQRLKLIGAKREWLGQEENFYYDTLGKNLQESNQILRFRREPTGNNVLTLKTIARTRGLPNVRYEYQFTTEHFKETHRILRHMGYLSYFNHTKKRQHWRVASASVELDAIGGRKYVQITGTPKMIRQMAIVLELDWNSAITDSYASILEGKTA